MGMLNETFVVGWRNLIIFWWLKTINTFIHNSACVWRTHEENYLKDTCKNIYWETKTLLLI